MGKGQRIIVGDEARGKLIEGIIHLSRAVSHSFGVNTRHTLVERNSSISLLNLLKQIRFQDSAMNAGVSFVHSLLEKPSIQSENGLVMTLLIVRRMAGDAHLSLLSGLDPTELKKGLDDARTQIEKHLNEQTMPLTTKPQMHNIILRACNEDEKITNLVEQVVEKLGSDGKAVVEFCDVPETTVSFVNGMQLNSGFTSLHFAKDKETFSSNISGADVLLVNEVIESPTALVSHLKAQSTKTSPLLIFANGFSEDVKATLIANQKKGLLDVTAITLPNKNLIFDDLSAMTGAVTISSKNGLKLQDCGNEVLGKVHHAVIKERSCLLKTSAARQQKFVDYIEKIQSQPMPDGIDQKEHLKRMDSLSGNLCSISVKMGEEEEKSKIESALACALAAKQDGLLPGSGSSLLFAANHLSAPEDSTASYKAGLEIVGRGVIEPIHTLSENLNMDGALLIKEITDNGPPFGLNVFTQKVENLIKSGIVDAKLELLHAVQRSCEITRTILETETLIINEERPKDV